MSSGLLPKNVGGSYIYVHRKYRVLDDYSRLRDIMVGLPAKRSFVPSLFMLRWSENHDSLLDTDLVGMVCVSHVCFVSFVLILGYRFESTLKITLLAHMAYSLSVLRLRIWMESWPVRGKVCHWMSKEGWFNR